MAELKPYTWYHCPGCGKKRHWTGAYRDPQPSDSTCGYCGSELVESASKDRRWRVSFEMVGPYGDDWKPVTRETDDEHGAREQYNGLLKLIDEGELIRNVKLEVSTTSWEAVEA